MPNSETMATSIRVNRRDKEEATEVFKGLGLDFSSGIAVYLRAVAREKRIPFDLALGPRGCADEEAR